MSEKSMLNVMSKKNKNKIKENNNRTNYSYKGDEINN